MNNYSEYKNILNSEFNSSLIFIIIGSLIGIGFLIWCYHDTKIKNLHWTDKLVISMFLLLVIGCFMRCIPYKIDIKKENFITYTGEFYVKEFSGRGTKQVGIKKEGSNKSKNHEIVKKNIYDDTNVKNGNIYQYIEEDTSYKGTFVYSKYSKVLVDIYVETKLE